MPLPIIQFVSALIPIVFGGWALLALASYWLLPLRSALLTALLTGWLLLPVAWFSDAAATADFGYAILCTALPGDYLWTKATVLGGAALLGALLAAPGRMLTVRWHPADLLMVAWIAWPLVCGLGRAESNAPDALSPGWQSVYLLLAWGGPYWLGRALLGSGNGLRQWGVALVWATAALTPVIVLEWLLGPRLYSWVYGFHPYVADGVERFVGQRGLVLLEHGNQLGIWLAGGTVTAWLLWRAGELTSPARWLKPGALVALCAGSLLLSQSVGPIVLTLGALALGVIAERKRAWLKPLGLALVIVLALALVGTVVSGGPVRFAQRVLPAEVIDQLRGVARAKSLGYRLAMAEEHLPLLRAHLGRGTSDWRWWSDAQRPAWSLWIQTLGQYGAPAVLLSVALLLLPGALGWRAWWKHPRELPGLEVPTAVLLLLLALLDNLLNPTFNTIWLAAAGGLLTVGLTPPPPAQPLQPAQAPRPAPSAHSAHARPTKRPF